MVVIILARKECVLGTSYFKTYWWTVDSCMARIGEQRMRCFVHNLLEYLLVDGEFVHGAARPYRYRLAQMLSCKAVRYGSQCPSCGAVGPFWALLGPVGLFLPLFMVSVSQQWW